MHRWRAERLGLTPSGATSFSSTEAVGVAQRIPGDVLWVVGTYSDEAAQKALAPQLDSFIAALEDRGAKRYTPTPARYAGRYLAWSRLAPFAEPEHHVETYVYLRYAGKDLSFISSWFPVVDRKPQRSWTSTSPAIPTFTQRPNE